MDWIVDFFYQRPPPFFDKTINFLFIDRLSHICPLIRVSSAYGLGCNTHPSAVSPR
ncbi:MAG: hypothetical protein IGQ45_10330 [Cyanobacterium sp. T60_A2020_053]|nr:hypothetical protein [Cyanobacterium sp. T60_A2020_053]